MPSSVRLVITSLFLALPWMVEGSAGLGKRNTTCTTNQRKSWNALTDTEKQDYLDAQSCLMGLPPKLGTVWNAQNRWDEFDFVHIHLSNFIHDSGQFLPFHRWFITVLERALQEECGYKGALPYWDELKDQAEKPLNESAVLQANYGFGGDGNGEEGYSGKCITDGPFYNTTLVMNATSNFDPGMCISRQLNQTRWDQGPSDWEKCANLTTYNDYWECTSNNNHGLGHQGLGGIMNNAVMSSGDPVFYLHHAWLDRAWWKWQLLDKENRLYDIGSARNIPNHEMLYVLGSSAPNMYLLDYCGDNGNVTTLNHVLYTYDLKANVTVEDVMDLNGETICAEYVDDGDFDYSRGY